MHSTHGYLVLVLAFALSAIDASSGVGRVISYARSIERDGQCSVRSFWNRVILNRGGDHVHGTNTNAEYTRLVVEEAEELDGSPKTHAYHHHRYVDQFANDANIHDDETAQWVDKVRHHSQDLSETPMSDRTFIGYRSSRGSQHSDDTLQDQGRVVKDISSWRRLGQLLFGTLQRFLILAGFAQLMHGFVIYTGGCRANYLNGCLAHIISEPISLSLFSNILLTQSSCRGWHFLVFRSREFFSFPWIIFRLGLGMEPCALRPSCLRGIWRVVCDLPLRHNKYVDGTFWRASRRPLYQQADSTYQHRRHVLVRGSGRDWS